MFQRWVNAATDERPICHQHEMGCGSKDLIEETFAQDGTICRVYRKGPRSCPAGLSRKVGFQHQAESGLRRKTAYNRSVVYAGPLQRDQCGSRSVLPRYPAIGAIGSMRSDFTDVIVDRHAIHEGTS